MKWKMVRQSLEQSSNLDYVLNSYGWNDIVIEATTPDGRQATLVHRVQRIPDHREYTKLAWPIKTDEAYDYLSQSTSALIGQNIRVQRHSNKKRRHRYFSYVSV